jgi:Flp pilus assembly protein TadG
MIIRKRDGQTVIELMLILPIFMMIIFVLLELGNLAYHTIMAHHVSYEIARVGSLVGVKKHSGATDSSRVNGKMKEALNNMMGLRRAQQMQFSAVLQKTSVDPQVRSHDNEDLVVTLVYRVNLVYPLTSFLFADEPRRLGIKRIRATVRMPVERPLIN